MYSKLEFELEFITPAFIGGAFNEEEVELRPASLIGSLRYWFRNLLGTITDDVDAIYKLEEELFGSQQKAGAVKVKVSAIAFKIKKDFNHLEEKELEALSYIGFGNILKKKGNYIIRPYLDIGSKFQITFLVPKKYEDLFVSFLYLYNFLGSLGGRSRRGWGNFILKPISGLKEEFRNLNWEDFDIDSIKWVYKSLKAYSGIKSVNNKILWKIDIFEPNEERFLNNSVESILVELSKTYKRFRFKRPPDYDEFYELLNEIDKALENTLKNRLDNSKIKKQLEVALRNLGNIIYNRIWFGLPINNISYKDLKYVKGNIVIDAGRLASPVIFRLVPAKGNTYKLLILVKYYQFWTKIIKKRNGQFLKIKKRHYVTFFNKKKQRGFWCIPKISFNKENHCLNPVKAKINVSQKGLQRRLNNILKSISKQVITNQSFEDYIEIFLNESFEINKNNPILTLGG